MSAMAMYPPVFREPEKRDVTRQGLDFLAAQLARPGTVVGMHPEGTRGKGPDPYELLPPEPGFGRVVLESHPNVIPIFINGLGNNFVTQVRSNHDGTGRAIIIVVGAPLDLAPFFARRNSLRVQKEIADVVLEQIRGLGDREREYRAELERHPVCGPVIR
jgi:1-acyl-sn-glycerol-3-phosphate acyltransferase